MSALGHNPMSALPPKADIRERKHQVRFSNRPVGVKRFQTVRRFHRRHEHRGPDLDGLYGSPQRAGGACGDGLSRVCEPRDLHGRRWPEVCGQFQRCDNWYEHDRREREKWLRQSSPRSRFELGWDRLRSRDRLGFPRAPLLTNLSQALASIKSVTMIIGTGNDNARPDTELQATLPGVPTICLKPSNNADSDSVCPNGGSARDQQGNQEWKNFTTSTQTFSFTPVPAPSLTSLQIKLFEHNNGTETDDNWDIQSIAVIATDINNDTAPLLNVGNPPNGDNCIVRLTGKIPSFTFNLSQSNPTNANAGIPPGSCPQSQ